MRLRVLIFGVLGSILQITTATLTCGIQAINNVVFTNTGSFSVTFTTGTIGGTSVNLVIPSTWSSDSTRAVVQVGTTTCVVANPSTSTSRSCTVTATQATQATCASFTISTATQYTINCSNILTPSSSAPAGSFTVNVISSTGGTADTCSGLTIQSWTPNTISSSSASLSITQSSKSVTPNTEGKGTFTLQLSTPVRAQDQLMITLLDGGIQFTSGDLSVIVQQGTTSVFICPLLAKNTTQYNCTAQNTLNTATSLSIFTSTSRSSETGLIAGPCLNLQNASFATLRNGYYIDILPVVSFTPSAGELTFSLTSLANLVINQATSYTFTIQLGNPLTKTGYLQMTIPQNIGISSTITCTMQVNTSTATTGTCTASNRIITMNGLFSTAPDKYSTLTLVLTGLINPSSTDATVTITTLQSYYASDQMFMVDQNIAQATYRGGFSPGAISSVSITPQSYTVGATTGLVLVFTLSNKLPSSGSFQLNYPNDFSLATGTQQCRLNGVQFTCTILNNSTTITISSFTSDLQASISYTLTISNLIINPLSLRPTGIFQIRTYTQAGIIIDQILSISGLTMTTPSAITLAQLVKRDSDVNGATTNYYFNFQLSTPTPLPSSTVSNSQLIINIDQSTFATTLSVSGDGNVLSSTLPFTRISATQISVTLVPNSGTQVPASQQFSITIKNVINWKSFAPSAAFTFIIMESTYKVALYANSDVKVTNDESSPITNNKLVIAKGILGQLDTYTFSFITTQSIDQSSYFTLQVPTQITLKSSIDCSQNYVGFSSAPTCSVSGKIVTITLNDAPTNSKIFGFSISNSFTNPNTNYSDNFVLSSFQKVGNVGYLMDTYTGSNYTFVVRCKLPCATCTSSSQTQCLSCYTDSTISLNSYYKSDTLSCVISCPSTYYQNTNTKTCQACPSNCLVCDSSLACTTCATKYVVNSGQCISTCASNQYVLNGECQNCNSSCSTCSSQNVCTSCIASQYLYNAICYSTCPSPLFGVNKTCVGCTSPCQTCSDSPTSCDSCDPNSNTPLLIGKTCTDNCTSGYYNSFADGLCKQCVTPCQTCTSSTSCLSCDQSTGVVLYQLDDQCLESCPLLYYGDGFNCVKCQSGCANCTQLECLQCSSSYLKLGKQCRSSCPTGYISNYTLGICQLNLTNSSNSSNTSSSNTSIITKENLQPTKYVPIPYTILLCIFGITVIVSKIHKVETFIPGAMLGFGGVIEWCSWVTLFSLFEGSQNQMVAIYLAFALHYLLNLINMVLIRIKIWDDVEFQKWYSTAITHKIATIIVYIVSLFFTFKMSRLLYSKYFAFNFFKAKLQSVQELWIFNAINGISIIFTTIPAAVGSALVAYGCSQQDQLFISAIDCFIVTILIAVFQIWETQKEEIFFEEQKEQQYYSLNATKIEKADDSAFFMNHGFHPKQVEAENDQSKILDNDQLASVRGKQNGENEISDPNGQDARILVQTPKEVKEVSVQANEGRESIIQNSSQKSNSKHTIYFGQNPVYKVGSGSAMEKDKELEKDDQSNRDSLKSGRYANGIKSPIPKQSIDKNSITEHAQEGDPDEEPILQNIDKAQDKKLSPMKSDRQGTHINNTTLSQNNSQRKGRDKSLEKQPYQTQDEDESKLSIFDNDDSQVVVKKNSFDSSSLAAKTLIHGPNYATEQENSIINDERSLKPGDPLLVEQLQVKIENLDSNGGGNGAPVILPHKGHSRSQAPSQTRSHASNKLGKTTHSTQSNKKEDKLNQRQNTNPVVHDRGRVIALPGEHSEDLPRTIRETKDTRQQANSSVNGGASRKTKPSPQSSIVQGIGKPNRNSSIPIEDDRMKQIFDSNESIHTLSDANWGENQISPSDFNVLNQRYDDEQPKAVSKSHPKAIGSSRAIEQQSRIRSMKKSISPKNGSGDEYSVPPGPYRTASPPRIIQQNVNPMDDATLRQMEQGRLRDIEKIYLQRIENQGQPPGNGVGGRSNKKKGQPRQKDISDALYIDDNFDENDIIF